MGYDSTITVYNNEGKCLGTILSDISFRAISELLKFSRENQISSQEKKDLSMFHGSYFFEYEDIACNKEVLKTFLYICEKQGIIGETSLHWSVDSAQKILSIKEVKFFGITSI